MAVINEKQITKSNVKSKLIEFNDNLQLNDFSDETGVKISTVHGKYSRIQLVMIDFSAGSTDKTIVVTYNIMPEIMKTIAESVILNQTADFEEIDKYSKQAGFTESKINFYKKDKDGYSPCSMLNIRYQANMNSPWTITIETGKGKAEKGSIGGINIAKGTYVKESSVVVYLSRFAMKSCMLEVRDYIRTFEIDNFEKMMEYRFMFEQEQKEKYQKSS